VGARHSQIGERIDLSPIRMLPVTGPIGAFVIRNFWEFSGGLRARFETQIGQAAQVIGFEVSTLVWRGGSE
jgi:hypothetical protein